MERRLISNTSLATPYMDILCTGKYHNIIREVSRLYVTCSRLFTPSKLRARGRREAFECSPCRLHVVIIRLREPGSWTQRLRKGVTKRCLALEIWLRWRTHTSHNDSAEEICQFFLGTEANYSLPPCSSSGIGYRGEHAEYSTCNTRLADLFAVAGCP